ncbi:uncharacterized protein RHO17_019302 [Thomomys bottae]
MPGYLASQQVALHQDSRLCIFEMFEPLHFHYSHCVRLDERSKAQAVVKKSCSSPAVPGREGQQPTMHDPEEEKRPYLGSQSRGCLFLVLQLVSIKLLAGLLVAILFQESKDFSSQEKEMIYQDLIKLKAGVDRLCRPCPWDWAFFQGNCYFLSKTKEDWNNSVAACQDMGAELVVIRSDDEQGFLQVISKDKDPSWIGLSDVRQEVRLDERSKAQAVVKKSCSSPAVPGREGQQPTMHDPEEEKRPYLGCPGQSHFLLVLHLLSIILLAGLLTAILVPESQDPSSQGKKRIYQELSQLKARVDSLCRPCPWDWTLFQQSCYFFSKSKRNWNDSSFLQVISKDKDSSWIGLSNSRQEGNWLWLDGTPLDGTPLSQRLGKYQKKDSPHNSTQHNCAEVSADGWKNVTCDLEKFWICKKSSRPCSNM